MHFVCGFDCYGPHIEDLAVRSSREGGEELVDEIFRKGFRERRKDRDSPNYDQLALQVRAECRSFVQRSVSEQMTQLLRWGIMTDPRYSYFTMCKH